MIANPEDATWWFYVPLKVSTHYVSNLLGTLVVGTRCLKHIDSFIKSDTKKRTYPNEGTYRWCVCACTIRGTVGCFLETLVGSCQGKSGTSTEV